MRVALSALAEAFRVLSSPARFRCKALAWPAHERYLSDSVAPLGDRVLRIRAPTNDDDVNAAVELIFSHADLGAAGEL